MSGGPFREADAADLAAFLAELRRRLTMPGRLYLLGATSHLALGHRARVERLDLAGEADGDGAALAAGVRAAAAVVGVALDWEHPGDVIPLPDGHRNRCQDSRMGWRVAGGPFEVLHFDPYSVVLRLLARGDEPDYHVSLDYVRHGLVDVGHLEALLADVLPRFTSETIQQDPAEFRRKFRGFRQMWRARAASLA